MKTILQEIFIYTLSLYLTSLVLPGVTVSGGFQSYVLAGILLAVGFTIIKPILSIVSLPFNMLTLGLFSFILSAFILFFVTKLAPSVQVGSFQFPEMALLGIQLKNVKVSGILSFVIISATIYTVSRVITWIFD